MAFENEGFEGDQTSPSSQEVEECSKPWEPAEGGLWAWLAVAASCLIIGITFGIIKSFGVIYVELLRSFQEAGVIDASSRASLVGSLSIGIVYFLSPISGILTSWLGIRFTCMIGGGVAALGMLAASWLTHWVAALYFSYALLFGCGVALTSTPSLTILGFHFRKRLGLVSGVSTGVGAIFAVILPPSVEAMLPSIGLPGVLRVFALLLVTIVGLANLYTIPPEAVKDKPKPKLTMSSLINKENWKSKKYIIWCLALPFAYYGYFVPYVHIVKYINVNFPTRDGKMFIMCINFATGISRILLGVLSDFPKINRVFVQQATFLVSGTLIMLLSVANKWELVITMVIAIGLCDGGYVSLVTPIAFSLCGVEGAPQAIGFVFGVVAIPLTAGPPVAGHLFDLTGSYYAPFLMAGASPILGGLFLFAMLLVRGDRRVEGGPRGVDLAVMDSSSSLAQIEPR